MYCKLKLFLYACAGKHPPSNGAAGRAGGLNMAFDPHKAKNAGAEGLLVGDLLFQKV